MCNTFSDFYIGIAIELNLFTCCLLRFLKCFSDLRDGRTLYSFRRNYFFICIISHHGIILQICIRCVKSALSMPRKGWSQVLRLRGGLNCSNLVIAPPELDLISHKCSLALLNPYLLLNAIRLQNINVNGNINVYFHLPNQKILMSFTFITEDLIICSLIIITNGLKTWSIKCNLWIHLEHIPALFLNWLTQSISAIPL